MAETPSGELTGTAPSANSPGSRCVIAGICDDFFGRREKEKAKAIMPRSTRSIGWRVTLAALAVPVVLPLAGIATYPADVGEAWWQVSGCRLDRSSGSPLLYADVSVKNQDPNTEHTYYLNIEFSEGGDSLGAGSVAVGPIGPRMTGENDSNAIVSNPSSSASAVSAGSVDCKVTGVADENEKDIRWVPKDGNGDTSQRSQGTYTVRSGDTLSGIAEDKCDSAAKWTAIYDANRSTIENAAQANGRASSDHGHWIYPGTELRISCG